PRDTASHRQRSGCPPARPPAADSAIGRVWHNAPMPNPSDLEWLGLHAHDTNHWSFELGPSFTRHDGKLFGGTGIAVAVATMEAATARDALWTTVQYAGSADIGERIDCHVDVLAHGKRTSQVRVTATVGERVVIAAVGATG